MTKLRKYILYIGITIILFAAVAVGFYFYTLNHYASQIDTLMDIFLAEMQEDEPLQQKGPENKEVISLKAAAAEDAGETKPQETVPGKEEKSSEPEQASGGSDNTRAQEPAKTEKEPPAPTPNNEKEGLQELEEIYAPAFKNVGLKDQLFTLQMLRKFSIDELQEMYRLYQAGGESWGKLLSIMEQKITPENLERIKQVAMKYKGLVSGDGSPDTLFILTREIERIKQSCHEIQRSL